MFRSGYVYTSYLPGSCFRSICLGGRIIVLMDLFGVWPNHPPLDDQLCRCQSKGGMDEWMGVFVLLTTAVRTTTTSLCFYFDKCILVRVHVAARASWGFFCVIFFSWGHPAETCCCLCAYSPFCFGWRVACPRRERVMGRVSRKLRKGAEARSRDREMGWFCGRMCFSSDEHFAGGVVRSVPVWARWWRIFTLSTTLSRKP